MEDCRMIFISDFANVTCQSVTGRTPEEEKELRDSYEVKRSVKEAHKKEMKRKNYYRLVNGRPQQGETQGWRCNEWLVESGFFLLDWDILDKDKHKKKINSKDVWEKLKPHIEDWGIVHAEKSARGGLHITLIRTEDINIEQNIRLMELRTGIDFDHACKDLARACFLVPNDHVIYQTEAYHEDFPKPLPLMEEDRKLLEKDREEQALKHRQEVEERRKTAPALPYAGLTDEASQLKYLINLICQQKVDLTYNYDDWIRIGFIITNIMGMAGEPLFQVVSSFYPKYDYRETRRTYSNLTRTTRRELTLGSLIHLARIEGVVN